MLGQIGWRGVEARGCGKAAELGRAAVKARRSWRWQWYVAVLAVQIAASAVAGDSSGGYTISGAIDDLAIDPAEFFVGSKQRPKLEILSPQNGQILDVGDLEIRLRLDGYAFPSQLHDSRICLGLASDDARVIETCYDQSLGQMEFHASNLVPGAAYMLRVVLFERSNALAVSVRSFRVGAVSLPEHDDISRGDGVTENTRKRRVGLVMGGKEEEEASRKKPVTIRTALQVAISEHSVGKHDVAERIYLDIIGQHPKHADALHLLGLVHYQRGDPETAISFIERALHTNSSTENFHNSLGECMRAAGRSTEALSHFQQALTLKQDFFLASFNLGLTYQQMNDWNLAMSHYREITATAETFGTALEAAEGMGLNAEVLMEARVRECDLVQSSDDLFQAKECWERGAQDWPSNHLIQNELGSLYLSLGELDEAMAHFQTALGLGMPLAEFNLAVVLELQGRTEEAESHFQTMLQDTLAQGLPTRHILVRMATVLPRVIPPRGEMERIRNRFSEKLDALISTAHQYPTENSEPLDLGFSTGFHLAFHGVNNKLIKSRLHRVYLQFCPPLAHGVFISEDHIIMQSQLAVASPTVAAPVDQNRFLESGDVADDFDDAGHDSTITPPVPSPVHNPPGPVQRPIRVGWVSRFFYRHVVGYLSQGIIAELPRPKYHVVVFRIDSSDASNDDVSAHIERHADDFIVVPPTLNICADLIRRQELDILIYPEVGLEPVAYFLSFARLAPVQAVWWGHADTTGVPSLDYFVSSNIEVAQAEQHYSESLVRFNGLGVFLYRPEASTSDPTVVRAQIRQQLNLPHNAHFYLCPQALFKFHPDFDNMLVEILSKDRLAYFLLLDGKDKHAWSKQLVQRIQEKMEIGRNGKGAKIYEDRVLFYTVSQEEDMNSLYQASDVVLDTYPVGGIMPSLQAMAVGAPVVTLPSELLGGRFTYGLYKRMGILECVAKDPKDYVSIALKFAYNKQERDRLSATILARNHMLFHDEGAIDQWDKFLEDKSLRPHHQDRSTSPSPGTPGSGTTPRK